MNKKGNVNSLFPIVTTLIIVGILFGAGLMILSQMTTASYDKLTAVSVGNELLAKANTPGVTLATGNNARDGACGAITAIKNTTGGYPIGLGNITQTGCVVTNKTTSTEWSELGANWYYNYTYTWSADTNASVATNAVSTATSGLATTWIPVIIVVIAAGLVLSILLGAFGGGKRK